MKRHKCQLMPSLEVPETPKPETLNPKSEPEIEAPEVPDE